MNDLNQRIANLSPAKRALLNQRLFEKSSGLAATATVGRRILPGPASLSFAQERLWFFDQFEPNNAAYNIPMALRLAGALDTAALQRCLNEVLRRHESLRTCFTVGESQPAQVIQPAAPLEMPLIDLAGSPEPEREETARRLCAEEAQRPFDLTRDILLRAKLFRLGDADHILLLTMHHIASDGWSMGLLNRELGTLYEAFVEGKPSPLPELPVQYADFAAWQREWLQGEALEKQLAYWRRHLEGAPAMLELPTDRPRPAVQSYRGALMWGELPEPLSTALKELSRAEGATLFMTLLAAFQTLLHRFSGSDQIVVGSPIAGRQHTEIEQLIGFFVNTLVMRGDLSGNPPFRTLLARTREAALGAYAHQDLPFEKLVEELHPDRSPSHAPIFQVLFTLQNAPWEAPALPGLDVAPIPVDIGVSKFDLSFIVRERDGRLSAVVEYCTDLFEAETIRRMLGRYRTLLEGIVANPDHRLSDLPLLTEAERQQLLVEWNRTEVSYPKDRCLHELFEEQVERTPDAIAVVFEDKQLSYRQLNERANQLAHHLQGLGVGPDTLVGICVERSLEMVVGLLGILKAGGAFVPLDPEYPKERLAFMLEDAGAPVLLTQAHLTTSLPAPQARIVRLDADWPLIAKEGAGHVASSAGSQHLAYMIYTSGSTGRPKGTMIPHRAIVSHMRWMQATFPLDDRDSVLQKYQFSFDPSVWEFFAALLVGGRLILAQPGAHVDPAYLAKTIRRHRVAIVQLVPSQLRILLDTPEFGACDTLRRVFVGGEILTNDLVERFYATLNAQLYNLYGPTEVTIASVFFKVPRDYRGTAVPIGKPVANTQAYILDARLEPVPVGVSGELYLGGLQVGRGYHNRPELTAEKFVLDPFRSEPGARLYETGDLARYLPDGAIEYLGRLDHQVKIRGFRIELGEIESVLAALPGVREAVVLGREDVPGEKRLAAYVTVKEGEPPKDSELRGLLRAKLPEYMIPSAFVVLDRLPLTPNGKVDRKALPRPDLRSSNPAEFASPETKTQKALAGIWREALGVERVGLHDNFFELGGHSLLAARVIGKINTIFQIKLGVGTLFLAPTIETLAPTIEENLGIEDGAPQVICLRNGNVGPPIYFINAGPTELRIAELLGDERPVFLVHLPIAPEWRQGITTGNSKALPTVEELGARFGDAVCAHAGSTPCVLVGYSSFWGRIAFDAARALMGAGGKVAYVLLIDAFARPHATRGVAREVLHATWRGLAPGSVDEIGGSRKFSLALLASGRLLWWMLSHRAPGFLRQRCRALISKPILKRLPLGSTVGGIRQRILDEMAAEAEVDSEHSLWSLRFVGKTFNPRTLDAKGVLIRSKLAGDESLPRQYLTNGWRNLFAQGLEVIQVSGDNWSVVIDQTFRVELARAIASTLDRYCVALSPQSGRQMPQSEVADA